ncbi:sensor histidine kinase [Agrobacterium tumefaciens]|uniref:sensor histidine kinase n=1 Tax=Agrobacterium tumefaciens TaxID=358 RepID=UPI0015748AEE|nr:sensor histidine kinase [Agrobacterium tumefaciens]MEA1844689.1 HWE histidine kinase domain-containing protein [Agrobacterium tumefaciens]NTA45273.1 PAS domain-containing protein [Agrobacterium tumefaciens]UXT84717.1 PAS domain-containing protein [Agrobacterium tumefaciens]WCK21872.1 HWE histidine kinase domain-containing protein [Agrobacterium tumefaciens]WIE35729.1 HWE histidine kinase domain-containing protein [Agrobacterium tumefaciens]
MKLSKGTSQPEWSTAELRRAIQSAGVALWAWIVDDDTFVMDAKAYELWDICGEVDLTFEHLSAKVHPADRDRVRAAFVATRAIDGPFEIDFRILTNASDVRWISARGQGNEGDAATEKMTGIFLDVTGRKQAEEGHELLAGEMSHRVKNILALASGLTNITSRTTETKEEMAKQLTERLTALGRAHELVRPLPDGQGRSALLGDLFAVLLAPYDDVGAFAGRIRVAVPRMGLGEKAATSLALVIHELATNSLKYGALSNNAGLLDISGSVIEDEVEIVWSEHGGDPAQSPRSSDGYGSKMLHRTVSGQLGGSIDYNWVEGGVVVTLRMKESHLSR